MNSVYSVIAACLVIAACRLDSYEAANLQPEPRELELETTTSTTFKYSNDGYPQYFEALKKLLGDLEAKTDKLETILKSCKQINHDLVVFNDLKKYVELMLKRLSAENSTLTEEDQVVPERKKKYTIFSDTDQKTWSSAKTACKEKGMELASVENEEEEMELEAILKSCGYNLGFVWIGASDIESEGEFIWSSSGRPLSYTNWDPYNAGGTKQNCLAAGGASDYYKWADRPCEELHTYVCEY